MEERERRRLEILAAVDAAGTCPACRRAGHAAGWTQDLRAAL